jgi:hypothetical protein
VVITPNKQSKHSHLETLDKFYNIMSDSKGEELIEMLSRENGTAALEILDKLPLVKKLQEKVAKLSFKDPN